MGRRVVLARWASLEVRRRGLVALVRRLWSGSWPTYTAPVYGSMVLDVPDGVPEPDAYLTVSTRGRAVIYCGSDEARVLSREVKELSLQ